MVTGSVPQPFKAVMLTQWENYLDSIFFLLLLGEKKFKLK